MITFVLRLDDAVAYPPCGLRVANANSWQEMQNDCIEFFRNAFGNDVTALEESNTDEQIRAAIMELAGGRDWSLSDDFGYYEPEEVANNS